MKILFAFSIAVLFFPFTGKAGYALPDSLPAVSQSSSDSLSFLPRGIRIFSRNKRQIIFFLPKDTLIQGLPAHGGSGHNWQTAYFTNGQLRLIWLTKDTQIQGIPCMAASFWTEVLRWYSGSAAVYFYKNGQLAQCKLARDFVINGIKLKKGKTIHFNRNGSLNMNTTGDKPAE